MDPFPEHDELVQREGAMRPFHRTIAFTVHARSDADADDLLRFLLERAGLHDWVFIP